MVDRLACKVKSVESSNHFKSVVQTNYDIIKVHGGELKVETEEGEFAEFTIILPLKENSK